MNSKKFYACACCGGRLTSSSRRPLIGKCIRLFVTTRLFPMALLSDIHICTKCRLMDNRWINLSKFYNILRTIDNNHEEGNTVIGKVNNEDGESEVYMDAENNSCKSINDEYKILNKTDTSSNNDECFNDSTTYGNRV